MATQRLDEIQWYAPDLAKSMGGVHENTVLFYFAQSPFYEPVSSNEAILVQANHNPSMSQAIETRIGFEEEMSKLSGVEFVVALGPWDFQRDVPIGESLFVIRKQNRRKAPGRERKEDDEVTVLATYYVAGELVFMAPSVKNILGSRLLTASYALQKFVSTSSKLPFYSPATGYRYIKPTIQPSDSLQPAAETQQSRASTPVADHISQIESVKPTSASAANIALETRLLYDSFNRFLQYRGEYMDENPLLGEPGNFVFSSSRQAAQSQQSSTQKSQQVDRVHSDMKHQSATPQQSSTPQPADAISPERPEMPSRKASSAPKPKRRRSKAPTGPPSPAAAEVSS